MTPLGLFATKLLERNLHTRRIRDKIVIMKMEADLQRGKTDTDNLPVYPRSTEMIVGKVEILDPIPVEEGMRERHIAREMEE